MLSRDASSIRRRVASRRASYVLYNHHQADRDVVIPMAAPIILWNPKAKSCIESDDAGNKIVKTTLAPPIRAKPLYEAFDPGLPKRLCYVPRLTSFCIRALSKYPEQLHQLGQTRLIFQRKKKGGDNEVLRAVLPKWNSPDFSLLNVDH